jgi:alkyl sulfatase BDS1-like metallo-beta-lactamase superfamily hydrolase
LQPVAAAVDVVIAQHHWPVFGGDRARNFLHKQRNLYKYVHDQTLRLLNQGVHPNAASPCVKADR